MPDETFGTLHIALTALITGVLVVAFCFWLIGRKQYVDAVALGALAGVAVFFWRQSANMPQLNADGLSGFSANDWLAPVVLFVALGCYGSLRPSIDAIRFGKLRAAATVIALVINVVTI